MKLLVTGGAGFIGYHLCKRLLEEGNEVTCIDNFCTGTREHVEALSKSRKFNFIHHDVVEKLELRVDRIFNLACPASPPAYQADPIKTTLTSVLGTYNMLELARSNGARILQASTSEIYGDPLVHPQPEGYWGNVNTTGPRSCYDEGKRGAESLMADYHRIHGVDVRIARIFNTYGPEMRSDDGRVVSNFIMEALRGDDLSIYGDGSHTRSMCYVDDLVDGLMRLMDLDGEFPYPVNLGNPHEISVREFARVILSMTGSSSGIAHLPEPVNDPQKRCPDITLAKSVLGWEPKIALADGLQRTIAYFKAEQTKANSLEAAEC